MKSRIDDSLERMPKLSPNEVKRALKWINSLSKDELEKFELMARLQLAQILVKQYLKNSVRSSSRKPKVTRRK